MKYKIGVFVCGCGGNIADVVDAEKLAQTVKSQPDVCFSIVHNLLCSPDGKAFFVEQMKKHGATHAVVAACSPKDHEIDFQRGLEEAGLNRYMVQMANIREHCAWVTRNRDAAFTKSLAMLKAAIHRVHLHEALEHKEIECNADILVIGGGIAGIEAALLAAAGNRNVTIVEQGPTLGGRLPEFEEVAPNMECAPCLISPRLSAISEAENIKILTHARVTDIRGYFGNYEIKVEKKARQVNEDFCMGCDECINACPVSVPSDFHRGLGERKAIYVPFPGSVPNCAVIDRESCLRSKGESCTACADACPLEAVAFDQQDEYFEIKAGGIVIATGFESHDPSSIGRLGFGSLPEVYTLEQFERLASSNGPTGGKIVKRDGSRPQSIAFIHCAGREELGYCSGTCCQASYKLGILAQKADEESTETPKVMHFHTDLVSSGWLGARLLDKAKKTGSQFQRIGDPAATTIEAKGGGLRIQYKDGGNVPQFHDADMVVLVTGMKPNSAAKDVIKMLALTHDDAGFLAEDHPILRPAQASFEGVYLAGCSSGPKSIAESIKQAQAAAGTLLARLQPGKKLTLEEMIAQTDEDLCSRCLICVSVCPYKACEYDAERERVVINEVLCHGCGTCVAACPSGAAEARHFTDHQLRVEISEVLSD
ncbi:MAG: CoB--CoM heterodisulfide reductase iron-sulfur subunit A family protein [Candidatus Eisenbacteria bacterium]|nr:CoB--CoM heterodisulfide reductase iron-sulfur subunit A family protein [Candidatus Eisenbacteria bacterium]